MSARLKNVDINYQNYDDNRKVIEAIEGLPNGKASAERAKKYQMDIQQAVKVVAILSRMPAFEVLLLSITDLAGDMLENEGNPLLVKNLRKFLADDPGSVWDDLTFLDQASEFC